MSEMKSKTKQILQYEKVLSKRYLSNCVILLLKARWPSGLRRQIQKIFLWAFCTRMCAWVRILHLSNFAFKSQHFVRSSFCESQTKSKMKKNLPCKKLISQSDRSDCDIRFLKAGWPGGLRRQTLGKSKIKFLAQTCAWVRIPLLSKIVF